MVSKKKTSRTLATQRSIQRQQDQRDAKAAPKPAQRAAVQAGARRQPVALPAQHQAKPGREADLKLQPRFLAPDYRGSGKLEGLAALITGADSGIGRAVAVLFAREGADVAVAYHSSHDDAKETRRCIEAEGRRCLLLQGDVKSSAWCDEAVAQTVAAFGRLDVLVNNAAFQQHADALTDLDDRCIGETLAWRVQRCRT
jgi:short chain dehydrogenase